MTRCECSWRGGGRAVAKEGTALGLPWICGQWSDESTRGGWVWSNIVCRKAIDYKETRSMSRNVNLRNKILKENRADSKQSYCCSSVRNTWLLSEAGARKTSVKGVCWDWGWTRRCSEPQRSGRRCENQRFETRAAFFLSKKKGAEMSFWGDENPFIGIGWYHDIQLAVVRARHSWCTPISRAADRLEQWGDCVLPVPTQV